MTLRRGMATSSRPVELVRFRPPRSGGARRARVVMLFSAGTEHARFHLRRCLPVRLKPPLDARRSVVAVEELEMACESLTSSVRVTGRHATRRSGYERSCGSSTRARLKEVNQERWVEVQVNPRDRRRWLVHPAGGARLALELWFDAVGKDDVRRLTDRVAYSGRVLRGAAAC